MPLFCQSAAATTDTDLATAGAFFSDRARASAAKATIFQLIDVNDDQRLTKDEIDNVVNVGGRFLAEAITSWKWFQRFDKDRDDVLTRDEANQATVLSLWFKTNDRNGDRKLTVDELEDLPIAPFLIVR